MGGEKGEACEVWKDRKNVLTYVSREVLFHITGFYQWLVNSSKSSSLMTDKTSVTYVPWKPHIEQKELNIQSNIKTSEAMQEIAWKQTTNL